MLTMSLLLDGVVVNSNELLMKQHSMGQDEFIFAMYILASCLMFVAAFVSGELRTGASFLLNSDTMWRTLNPEGVQTLDEKAYGSWTKIICLTLFVSFGYFGSSCAGAITKHFGALSMR